MALRAPLLTAALALAAAALAPALGHAGELHDVTTTPAQGKVGVKGTANVTLSAKNGWHLNEQAPVSLKLAPGPGITVEKAKLVRKDLAEAGKEKARFDVAFTASEPGKKTIDGEANFVICQEQACKPVKEKITLAVDVAAK